MRSEVNADSLMQTVLAMDTYSRGNNPFWLRAPQLGDRPGLGQTVGNATIIGYSDRNQVIGSSGEILALLPNDTSIDGFSATAYSYNGKIVISYRGTVSDT